MADPSPSASAPASAEPALSAAPPVATEIVHRPDAGTLARGRWEAPQWAFYFAGGVVVLLALVYVGARVGLFKRRSVKP